MHPLIPVSSIAAIGAGGTLGPDVSGSLTSNSVLAGEQTLLNGLYFLSASMFSSTGSLQTNTLIGVTGSMVFAPNSVATFQNLSTVNINNGAEVFLNGTVSAGASSQLILDGLIEGTPTFAAGSTTTVSGTVQVANGANITIESGGLLNAIGEVQVLGSNTVFQDNNAPLFSTPQSVTVIQPFSFNANSTFTSTNGFSVIDDTSGVLYFPCENVLDGATLSSFVINVRTTTAPSLADATAILYQTDNKGLPVTSTALSTITIPTGLGNNTSYAYTGSMSPTVVNKARYTYFVGVTPSTTHALQWYAPQLNFISIHSFPKF